MIAIKLSFNWVLEATEAMQTWSQREVGWGPVMTAENKPVFIEGYAGASWAQLGKLGGAWANEWSWGKLGGAGASWAELGKLGEAGQMGGAGASWVELGQMGGSGASWAELGKLGGAWANGWSWVRRS